MSDIKRKSSKLNDCTLICLKLHCAGLSISFEVHVPIGKVGGSLLFKRRRHELPKVRVYFVKCASISTQMSEVDVSIMFVGSFPHFKFLTQINSKVRRKKPATSPY